MRCAVYSVDEQAGGDAVVQALLEDPFSSEADLKKVRGRWSGRDGAGRIDIRCVLCTLSLCAFNRKLYQEWTSAYTSRRIDNPSRSLPDLELLRLLTHSTLPHRTPPDIPSALTIDSTHALLGRHPHNRLEPLDNTLTLPLPFDRPFTIFRQALPIHTPTTCPRPHSLRISLILTRGRTRTSLPNPRTTSIPDTLHRPPPRPISIIHSLLINTHSSKRTTVPRRLARFRPQSTPSNIVQPTPATEDEEQESGRVD